MEVFDLDQPFATKENVFMRIIGLAVLAIYSDTGFKIQVRTQEMNGKSHQNPFSLMK